MNNQLSSLYTDGASRGNPGKAGAGIILYDPQGTVLTESKQYLGVCTNNEAEYRALILGLEQALKLKCPAVKIHLDSELVVRQMEGIYKIKNANLAQFAAKAKELLSHFDQYLLLHVPRHKNSAADQLANQAIDEHEANSASQ